MASDKPLHKYREALEHSIRQVDHEARRAENEDFDPDIFVDHHIIEQLEKPDWQIIYGRRGSGKTTLFQAFQDRVHRKGDHMCIYVTLKSCGPPSNGDKYTADEYASIAFREFTKKVCRTIFENAVSHNSFVRKRILGSSKKKEAEDIVQEIAREAEEGSSNFEISSRKEINNEVIEKEISLLSKIGTLLEFSGGGKKKKKNSRSIEDEITFYHSTRYRHIRDQFRSLCQCLDLKGIYILIDEWVSLDETAKTTIQPAFAELLKRTFSGSKKFSIKIASIAQQTRLHSTSISGKSVGLQIEADFFECADLDSVYANEVDVDKFYKEILYRRLLRHSESLISFSGRNSLNEVTYEPIDGFVENIFASDEAFHDVVTACAGNPRDFMILISRIAKHHEFSLAKLWTRGDVLRVIKTLSVIKENSIPSFSIEKEIINMLRDMARANNNRVFLVKKDINQLAEKAISALYMNRNIHPVKRVDIPPSIREHCNGYYLDFGKFLDVTEGVKSDCNSPECPFTSSSTLQTVKNFILDLESISIEELTEAIECPKCGAKFSKSERSYQLKQLCPVCFELQSEVSGL